MQLDQRKSGNHRWGGEKHSVKKQKQVFFRVVWNNSAKLKENPHFKGEGRPTERGVAKLTKTHNRSKSKVGSNGLVLQEGGGQRGEIGV